MTSDAWKNDSKKNNFHWIENILLQIFIKSDEQVVFHSRCFAFRMLITVGRQNLNPDLNINVACDMIWGWSRKPNISDKILHHPLKWILVCLDFSTSKQCFVMATFLADTRIQLAFHYSLSFHQSRECRKYSWWKTLAKCS